MRKYEKIKTYNYDIAIYDITMQASSDCEELNV